MMNAYIALGHGSEELVPREEQDIVPPGCTLVLAEECGMSAVLPMHIYKTITTSPNREYFRGPVTHKATLEALFRRPLRIYKAGERMPKLSLTLLSAFTDMQKFIEPSGLFQLPIPEEVLVKKPHAINTDRYLTPVANASDAFRGAVYPERMDGLKLRTINKMDAIHVTQKELFEEFPGVHYNLLCRAVNNEESELKKLVVSTAHEINPAFAVNLFATVDDWLGTEAATAADPEKTAKMRTLVGKVMSRRRSSGEPLSAEKFDRVVNMILAKRTPENILAEAVSKLSLMEIIQGKERREGKTLLGVAAYVGNMSAIRVLRQAKASVNARDETGETALMVALESGHLEAATFLLEEGTDISMKDVNGWTALMHACVDDNNATLIPRLITPALINHADTGGDTALHVAASYPSPDIVQLLLENGSAINKINKTGDTPLMTACDEANGVDEDDKRGYMQNAKILTRAGTSLHVRNAGGYSALSYAMRARMDETAAMLIENGARARSWLSVAAMAEQNAMPLTYAAAIAAREAGRSENAKK